MQFTKIFLQNVFLHLTIKKSMENGKLTAWRDLTEKEKQRPRREKER